MRVQVLVLYVLASTAKLVRSKKDGDRDSISTGVFDCSAQLVGCASQLRQLRGDCPGANTGSELIEDLLSSIDTFSDIDKDSDRRRQLMLGSIFVRFFRSGTRAVDEYCIELLGNCDGTVKSFECPEYQLPELILPTPTESPLLAPVAPTLLDTKAPTSLAPVVSSVEAPLTPSSTPSVSLPSRAPVQATEAPMQAATATPTSSTSSKPVASIRSSLIRTAQELRDAIAGASTDKSSRSLLLLAGSSSIVLETPIDLASKSFELLCETSPCLVTGNGSASLFTGSPANAQFNGIQFANGLSAVGGGAFLIDGGDVTFVSCDFKENKAQRGGAIYMDGTSVVSVISSTFESNAAQRNGGAIYIASGTLSMMQSQLSSNTAVSNGGAIYMLDGTMDVSSSTVLSANTAGFSGGAIFIDSATATIQGSSFVDNVAFFSGDGGGGAIAGHLAKLTIDTVVFKGNSAVEGSDILVEDDLDPQGVGSFIECANSVFCDGMKDAVHELGDGAHANTDCRTEGKAGKTGEC